MRGQGRGQVDTTVTSPPSLHSIHTSFHPFIPTQSHTPAPLPSQPLACLTALLCIQPLATLPQLLCLSLPTLSFFPYLFFFLLSCRSLFPNTCHFPSFSPLWLHLLFISSYLSLSFSCHVIVSLSIRPSLLCSQVSPFLCVYACASVYACQH